MKNWILIACIAGIITAMTSCAQGGTIILENQSSYQLTKAGISLGSSEVETLNPGQWINASHDQNVPIANVHFTLDTSGSNKVKVEREGKEFSGSWTLAYWLSSGFNVQDGETVVITVKNK